MSDLRVERGGVVLSGEEAGEGTPVVLLHGLTASRRYVVMGSRALERSGHRVIAYDARAHGKSSPADRPDAYGYDELCADLEAVLDAAELPSAVFAGASMGGHTALRLALRSPERVRGLVVITPGHDPEELADEARLARWDALADGLEAGGVEGFVRAYGVEKVPEKWRETITTVLRQRIAVHEHPEALADALRMVPRSAPFERIEDLGAVSAPTVVVASRDEADPGHPYALGAAYAEAIPGARLASEEPGTSPLAWQGGQLSKVIAELADSVAPGDAA